MRSFANLVVLLAFLPSLLVAQVPQIPRALEERVLRDLAVRLGVDASELEVEWVRQRGLEGFPLADSTSFRLLGSDRMGTYTVIFDGSGRGGVRSALLRVGVWEFAPVAARTLSPGDTLGVDDFVMERRLHWGAPVQDSHIEPPVGWIVQNSIRAGEIIRRNSVKSPALVKAGSPVAVVVARGRVRVELTGVAMKDARYGEKLLVKLDGDRGYVHTEVRDQGVVIVKEM